MTPLSHQKRKVGIIGAGLGGLSAAVSLAHAGFQVTVFEKNDSPGGKVGQLEREGFIWDTGPSVLTMPDTIRALFDSVGHKMEDFLTLLPLENAFRYRWEDGTVIDEDATFWKRPDVTRYLEHCRGLHELSTELCLYRDMPQFWKSFSRKSLAKLKHLPALLDPRSMHRSLGSFFEDEHLVQIFSRFAAARGSSPFLAPASLNVLPFIHAEYGAWYVKGGLHQIASALFKLARRFSVEFRFGSAITGAKRLANGHALAIDGAWERFDAVVCNKDALSAYQTLVSRELAAQFKREFLKRRSSSLSAFNLFLGVRKKYDGLRHHNVFFSGNYRQEFETLFHGRTPPDDPTIYLCVTSRVEPDRAPKGCDNWFVSVHAPPLGRKIRWNEVGPNYAERIVDRLERLGFKDLRQHIAVKEWFGPSHFRSQFSSYAGALHGFASHGLISSFVRPAMDVPTLPDFYFIGGSTRPGGGIPLVLQSGQIAARKIIDGAASA